ncbi:MAG: 3-deoxy-7-phosphoheptulonate synthase [Candidatus Scalindua sp.]|nr:3-deoxy-7-phosphoheptulonate synthase [Candidatus Scalindua sp.]
MMARSFDEAHIEYFRGIANQIGAKIGQSITSDELIILIDTLNPNLAIAFLSASVAPAT